MTTQTAEAPVENPPKLSGLVTNAADKVAELELLRSLLGKMANASQHTTRVIYSSFPANNSDD